MDLAACGPKELIHDGVLRLAVQTAQPGLGGTKRGPAGPRRRDAGREESRCEDGRRQVQHGRERLLRDA